MLFLSRKSWKSFTIFSSGAQPLGSLVSWRAPKNLAAKLNMRIFPDQLDLELVVLRRHVLLIRRDAAAAVYRAAAVGHLHVLRVLLIQVGVIVIIQERDVRIIALDQPAAGRIVMRRGQRQAGVLAQRVNLSAPGPCRTSSRRESRRDHDPAARRKQSPPPKPCIGSPPPRSDNPGRRCRCAPNRSCWAARVRDG